MRNHRFWLLFLLVLVSFSKFSLAEVKLPALVSDGMVLQRDITIPVWGWALPGEKVQVQFNRRIYYTVADQTGNWEIKLYKEEAGGPYSMVIQAENKIELKDILIGDVWVCSGQSNMEFQMVRVQDKYASEIASSNNQMIRQFKVEPIYDFSNPKNDVKSEGWKYANPENILDFTAVGYFFALSLYEKYQVPIGLILSSKGGTPVESWMSKEALKQSPKYLDEAQKWANPETLREKIENDQKRIKDWYHRTYEEDLGLKDQNRLWYSNSLSTSDWETMTVPGYWDEQRDEQVDGVVWCRKEIELSESLANKPAFLSLGSIADQNEVYLNGVKVGETKSRYFPSEYSIPENLLKEGGNVLTVRITNHYNAGGFIKDKLYFLAIDNDTITLEGEWKYKVGVSLPKFNRGTIFFYNPLGLFNGMIAPLVKYAIKGVAWYQGEANTSRANEYQTMFSTMIKDWRKYWGQGDFPFLFVQLTSYFPAVEEPRESTWAELREAQLETLTVSNTGMAVTIDIGEWNDVHPKNKKDVGKRLCLAAQKVAYSNDDIVFSGPILKSMEVRENKIFLGFNHLGSGLKTQRKEPLKYFTIAGEGGVFKWAQAKIEDGQVVVWNDEIKKPVAVRYAWADNPEGANLYNEEGLPASPFRTDSANVNLKKSK